jgi:hypothetical protein
MRLGFDLDGTLADMQGALAREARALFPAVDPKVLPRSSSPDADVPAGDLRAEGEGQRADDQSASESADAPAHALTARQQREVWKAACDRENFWQTLDEIEPGALARLARLVHDRRWELIFLTSRPDTRGDSVQVQSHRWLVTHGFPSPSVFVVHGSRGKIAAALGLDVVVDDRPENCLDVAIDSTARPILVWRGEADKVPASARQLGIGAVSSIDECLTILESLDESQPDGVVDRLKRLLGLKPRAARSRAAGESASAPAMNDIAATR